MQYSRMYCTYDFLRYCTYDYIALTRRCILHIQPLLYMSCFILLWTDFSPIGIILVCLMSKSLSLNYITPPSSDIISQPHKHITAKQIITTTLQTEFVVKWNVLYYYKIGRLKYQKNKFLLGTELSEWFTWTSCKF